jgi:hypothetical protein
MEFHDLARNGWFEGAIVICRVVSFISYVHRLCLVGLHGRSGNVALPRTKLVLAKATVLAAWEAPTRPALKAAELRSKAVAIFIESVCRAENLNNFSLGFFLKGTEYKMVDVVLHL